MGNKQQAQLDIELKVNTVVNVKEILEMDTERQQVLNNSIDTLSLRQGNNKKSISSLGGNTHTYRTGSFRSHATSS